MSHYADYRKECFNIDTFEDENGFISIKIYDDGNRLHIEDCWVKPELRSTHVAQGYQETIFKIAKGQGCKQISTSVSISNNNADETVAKLLHNKWKLGWTSGDYIVLVKDVL